MTNSALTKTTFSRNTIATIEGDQGIGFETAAAAAAAGLQGLFSMGAFPSSLIALGRIKRRAFDDTLTLRPKGNPVSEELDARVERNALADRVETTWPAGRRHLSPIAMPRVSA